MQMHAADDATRRRGRRAGDAPGDGVLDFVGVGIGPTNLSLAALSGRPGVRCRFFDRNPEFLWHGGLLFPETTIQNTFLKDLVTMVDPTNPYSFLAFLAAHKRLFRFTTASFPFVTRLEFNEYLQWASRSLPALEFGRTVRAINCDPAGWFVVQVDDEPVAARNVVLGTGFAPNVPACAAPHLGDRVFHASEYLFRRPDLGGQRVAVVGGGQTGGEIFYHAITRDPAPRQTIWITRRENFSPLDASPFANEFYMPHYVTTYFDFPPARRERLLAEHKLARDGINVDLLMAIYRRLYALDYLEGLPGRYRLLPTWAVEDMAQARGAVRLALRHADTGDRLDVDADAVVLCTGYRQEFPAYLAPLASRVRWDRGFVFRRDFSIEWDGPPACRIFVQAAGERAFGIGEPSLSIMAWRNAVILSSIVGDRVYDIDDASCSVEWALAARHEAETGSRS